MCEHSARKSAIIMAKQWIIELWLYVVARYPEFTSYCFIKIIGQLMVISKISLHAKPEEYKKKKGGLTNSSYSCVCEIIRMNLQGELRRVRILQNV